MDCLDNERCNAEKRCQGSSTEQSNPDGSNPDGSNPEGQESTQQDGLPIEETPEPVVEPPSIPGKSPLCDVESRPCYSGPEATQGKGACKAGKQRCVDGNWGPCVGEVTPKAEICDGIDNDCDGQIDANCNTWATSFGGKDGDEGNGIAVSPSGQHLYVTGSFASSAVFGTKDYASQGESDAYIAKLQSNGQILWVQTIGGRGEEIGKAVATNDAGEVFATGSFEGEITIGSTKLDAKQTKHIYIVKMDTEGKVIWATSAGGAMGKIEAHAIFADKTGHVYLTGSFSESVSFGSKTLTSKGYLDIFIAKLDPQGQPLWAVAVGGTDTEEGNGIIADDEGNVYVTGYYQGSVSFGATALSSPLYTNAFVSKLNGSGEFLWTNTTRNTLYASGRGIQVDKSGNVYIMGYFDQQVAFGFQTVESDYGTDFFVAKFAPTGPFQWFFSASGYGTIPGRGMGIDEAGNLYVTGAFSGILAFGSGTTPLRSQVQDIYAVKLNPEGKFVSAKAIAGAEVKSGDAIATDNLGNSYMIGAYRGSVNANGVNLSSRGFTDAFISKITF